MTTAYGMTSRHHHDSLTTEEEEGVNCHVEISTDSPIMPADSRAPRSRPPRPATTLTDIQALADSFQASIELQMGVTTRVPTPPLSVTPRLHVAGTNPGEEWGF